MGEEGTALNNGSSTCSFAVAANELHICTVILCNTAGYQVCSKTVALYPGHVARALRVLPLPLLSSRQSRAIARHLPYFAKSTNFRSCARRHGKLLRARGSFRNCAHVDKSLTNTNFAWISIVIYFRIIGSRRRERAASTSILSRRAHSTLITI